MAPQFPQSNRLNQIITALVANKGDAPHLEPPLGKLQGLMGEINTLSAQQNAHSANRQETTKRLNELMLEAQTLGTFLANGIREQYGKRSEKLVEFGLQPFRGRKVKKAPPEAAPSPAADPNPTPTTPEAKKP
jgi:hypothetical protein